mmetsp:Transcript_17245/g.27507  ORF Transcript_17245/g.27507 Transcript_17245/m.27507 type:complete len:209 (+) Transcript_17245:202-828(+)
MSLPVYEVASVRLPPVHMLSHSMKFAFSPLPFVKHSLLIDKAAGSVVKVLRPLSRVLLLVAPHTAPHPMAHVSQPLAVVGVRDLAVSLDDQCAAATTPIPEPLAVVLHATPLADVNACTMSYPTPKLAVVLITIGKAIRAAAIARRLSSPLGHGQSVRLKPGFASLGTRCPALQKAEPESCELSLLLPRRHLQPSSEVSLGPGRLGCG